MGKAEPNLVQQNYRIRDDDGSETGATWLENAGAPHDLSTDKNIRIRFLLEETAGANEANQSYEIWYNRNSTGWNQVTSIDTYVRPSLSSQFADGDDCTQQLGSGDFVASNGGMDEDGEVAAYVITASQETEHEYCIKFQWASCSDNDSFEFRVEADSGLDLDGYNALATITINKGPAVVYGSATISASAAISNIPSVNKTFGTATISGTAQLDAIGNVEGAEVFGSATISCSATIVNIPSINNSFGTATISASGAIADTPSYNTAIASSTINGSASLDNIPSFNEAIATSTILGIGVLSANGSVPGEEAGKKRLPRLLKRGLRKTQPSSVRVGQKEV